MSLSKKVEKLLENLPNLDVCIKLNHGIVLTDKGFEVTTSEYLESVLQEANLNYREHDLFMLQYRANLPRELIYFLGNHVIVDHIYFDRHTHPN